MIAHLTIPRTAIRAVSAATCMRGTGLLDISMLVGAGYLVGNIIAAALAGV